MDYVRLSTNLYIHHVRLSRNLYVHYVRVRPTNTKSTVGCGTDKITDNMKLWIPLKTMLHRPVKPTFTALTWAQLGGTSTYKEFFWLVFRSSFLRHFVDYL